MSNFEVQVLFFLEMVVILATCYVVGRLAQYFGQPQVVGEMIAGVVLGPSAFGLVLPELQQQLFPPQGKMVIYTLAQVGLVLYMFVIGLEFNHALIFGRLRSASSVSLAGIVTPFVLGAGLAYLLSGQTTYFGPNVPTWLAMLFLGSAMCITAFPMLARIIHERGLAGSSLGTLALAAGSFDDAVAWCVLAVVIAGFRANSAIAIAAIGGGALYAAVILIVVRRALRPFANLAERSGGVPPSALMIVLALVTLGAWTTDNIGIYAVFGAFLMGVAMPRGVFARELIRKIEPVTATYLLPLFFINSGLNTRIGLLAQPELWVVLALIILSAVAGKFGACWLAARVNGVSQRDALGIGSLMNARGLMELIAINIGLDQGIISPTLFAMLVVMAIVTTLMATPLFELVRGRASVAHQYHHDSLVAEQHMTDNLEPIAG